MERLRVFRRFGDELGYMLGCVESVGVVVDLSKAMVLVVFDDDTYGCGMCINGDQVVPGGSVLRS